MSIKSALAFVKGVMYDLDKPHIVEGKPRTDLEEAINQALEDLEGYISYRGESFKSVTFDMPNVEEALKGKVRHFDQPLDPAMQARYDATHKSQEEAR
jgi:hypothetical protein